jgi:hypothetical protein
VVQTHFGEQAGSVLLVVQGEEAHHHLHLVVQDWLVKETQAGRVHYFPALAAVRVVPGLLGHPQEQVPERRAALV